MVWWPDPKGCYSVRSAYKLCMEKILDPSHLKVPGDWTALWKLEVPPRVKNFIWRACRSSIPTRSNLRDRGVEVPNLCPWCSAAQETVSHNLLTCGKCEGVWRKLDLWRFIEPQLFILNYFREIFFEVLIQLSKEDKQCLAMTLWSLWRGRNQRVWEGIEETGAVIICRGKTVLEDWKAGERPQHKQQQQVSDCEGGDSGKWQKPPPGFMKCNIDAAFSQAQNRVGVGICLRDEHGLFMGAKTQWFHPIVDVKVGEAIGLQVAVEWIRELGFKDVVFEMDSKIVVDTFNSSPLDNTEFGCIVKYCHFLLSSYCTNSHVSFTRRNANMVAHTLAKAAIVTASPQVYIDIPACIDSLIMNEMH